MKSSQIAIFCAIAGALVVGCDFLFGSAPQASLLFNLVFWTAIFQGCIALVAAADLAKGKWVKPVQKELLSMAPLILLSAALFIFMSRHWHIYHFEHTHSAWFTKNFFLGRNIGVLVVSALFALKYRQEALKESESRHTFAVLYLFSFVATQSMIAFDWVMPLEYPWISTLFGPFFFIEAIYMGLVFSACFCLAAHRKIGPSEEKPKALVKAQYDTGVMLFGFSVMWAYFFFSQFIVIWYGNISEEVMFFTRRLGMPAFKVMAFIILAITFVIPFLTLVFQKVKSNPYLAITIGSLGVIGLFLEKCFLIIPAAKVSYPALFVQFALIAGLVVMVIRGHYASLSNES